MKRPVFFLAFSLLLAVAHAAPLDSIMNYIRHAMLFNKVYPQEKVYLHFDNTGYFKGERIWFKAYVVRTDNSRPSDISHVLYVDLLDPSGNVVNKQKVCIVDGMGKGDILLDSIFDSGFYEVRAYTRYMMNWGDETVFSRVFPIFNAPEQDGDYSHPTINQRSVRHRLPPRLVERDTFSLQNVKKKAEPYIVNLYPEGGVLVRGIRSRVAFDVINQKGQRESVDGLVTDAVGNTLTVVHAGANGRGMFEVVPSHLPLALVLTDADGHVHELRFPEVREQGCVVHLNPLADGQVEVTVSASDGMLGRKLGVTLMNAGTIYRVDTLTIEPQTMLCYPRTQLRPGVNQLTLFTSDGRIQAERLFFICPSHNDSQQIRIVPLTGRPTSCGKVELELQTQPDASLSFSAVDSETMLNGRYGTIGAYMLLGSDVKGFIAHPEYYFEADDEEHRRAADTLMMIQGWRRYDWYVMADVRPWHHRIQPIEDYLYVFGQLGRAQSRWKKRNPIGGVDLKAFLYNGSGQTLTGETTTDSAGHYAFRLPDISGYWNLQIESRVKDRLKTYNIGIDRHFRPAARYIFDEEARRLPADTANLFPLMPQERAATAEYQQKKDGQLVHRIGHYEFVTNDVTVKQQKHYWTDYSGGWYDERRGRRKASIYYDINEVAQDYIDQNQIVPMLGDWLRDNNPLFCNHHTSDIAPPHEEKIAVDMLNKLAVVYDGRPIVWIQNNAVADMTGYESHLNTSQAGLMDNSTPTAWNHPGIQSQYSPLSLFLDEIKAVYIVDEAPNLVYHYLSEAQEIANLNPVLIFLYTYPDYSTESKKGKRRTYFQGFNVPAKFEMDDYSVLPPMEDFRRTLYWDPDVKTDAHGRATVRFYNNSSCREMYVSAEGMTADGLLLSNE